MCLNINHNLTKEYKEKNEDILCYKLLTPEINLSPWIGMQYKTGWNVAKGEHIYKESVYDGALHVMLDKEEAKIVQRKIRNLFGIQSVIHEITGKVEDLIAVGDFEGHKGACFKKLYINLEKKSCA